MKPIFESQEFARRFNEEDGAWQRFQLKRRLIQLFSSDSLFSEEILDGLDWLQSERELRDKRYIGRTFP